MDAGTRLVLQRRGRAGHFTPAERETIRMVACGLSNHQIARRRYVAFDTVKTHLTRISVMLGARNRAHIVAQAIRLGVI